MYVPMAPPGLSGISGSLKSESSTDSEDGCFVYFVQFPVKLVNIIIWQMEKWWHKALCLVTSMIGFSFCLLSLGKCPHGCLTEPKPDSEVLFGAAACPETDG